MSGIRVGTRLERLYALRQRLNVEIEIEERKTGRRRFEVFKRPRTRGPNAVDQRLRELGVTTHDVKVWAFEHGVIPEIKRGRISVQLVETYAMHRDAAP